MNASMEDQAVNAESIAGQIADVFASGGTLGSMHGYEDRDYEAVYALGHNLYAQGCYSDALKAFAFLVMNNPFERRFVKAFASCLQILKQYEDAIQFHSLTSVMDMTDPGPTFHTGECLVALGRVPEAKDAFEIVLRQCKAPEQEALKQRAQALLDIINAASPSDTKETK